MDNIKIKQAEAQVLITRAMLMQRNQPTQRFGQCLWLLITQDHEDLAQVNLATDKDFFYQTNSAIVMEVFFEHYVEKEND